MRVSCLSSTVVFENGQNPHGQNPLGHSLPDKIPSIIGQNLPPGLCLNVSYEH